MSAISAWACTCSGRTAATEAIRTIRAWCHEGGAAAAMRCGPRRPATMADRAREHDGRRSAAGGTTRARPRPGVPPGPDRRRHARSRSRWRPGPAPRPHDRPGRCRDPHRAAVGRLVERLDRRGARRRRRPHGQAGQRRPADRLDGAHGRPLALAACVVLSMSLGWRAGLVHLATVASAWSYNLRLKSTVWSWAPYAFSFGFLPLAIALALPGIRSPRGGRSSAARCSASARTGPTWCPTCRTTGRRACVACRTGSAARPRASGPRVALVAATILVVLAPPGSPSIGAAAALVVALGLTILGTTIALNGGRSRLPFTAAIAVAASTSSCWSCRTGSWSASRRLTSSAL